MNERLQRWKLKNGTITLWPRWGRVGQVRVGGHDAFWANPTWKGDWNVGGDRLWVSPEVTWYCKSRNKLDSSQYFVPTAMDDGRWETQRRAPGCLEIRQRFTLRHHPARAGVRVEMARCFRIINLPDAPFFSTHVAYHTDNDLWVRSRTVSAPINLWSLIQVPPGGELIIPCRTKPAFRAYFGPLDRRWWSVSGKTIRFRITGQASYKIGVAPDLVTGRIAYARPVGGARLVIYRAFFPQPWRDYCDVPPTALKSRGDAVQAYNDNGKLGGFGEVEYHSPAIDVKRGPSHVSDSCLTVVGLVRDRDWAGWLRQWLH